MTPSLTQLILKMVLMTSLAWTLILCLVSLVCVIKDPSGERQFSHLVTIC